MRIDELAELMGKTREEVEYILETHDIIDLNLTKSDYIRMKWRVFGYGR